jgi:hypothetical protein
VINFRLGGLCCAAAFGLLACASSSPTVVGEVRSMDPVATGAEVPWGDLPASVAIDGVRGAPDPSGRFIQVDGLTAVEPSMSFLVHESLGRFRSAVITIREMTGGDVAPDGIFISDFAASAAHRIAPNRTFSLLDPAPGVIVGQGDRAGIRTLARATLYQLDLMVQCERGSRTVQVRFRTED